MDTDDEIPEVHARLSYLAVVKERRTLSTNDMAIPDTGKGKQQQHPGGNGAGSGAGGGGKGGGRGGGRGGGQGGYGGKSKQPCAKN